MKNKLFLMLLVLVSFNTLSAVAQESEPNKEYYHLSKDQYTPIAYPELNQPYEQFVIRTENYTRVDKVMRLMYDGQWIIISSTNELVDRATNNRYRIHSIDNDVPMDRILVISNEKDNTIVISSFYPPLPKKVKYVDIISRGGVSDEIKPSNGMSSDRFALKVYNKEKDLPYYKSTQGNVIRLEDDFVITDN